MYWIKRAIKSVHLHSNKTTLDALPDFSQAAAGTSLTKKSDGSLAFETSTSSYTHPATHPASIIEQDSNNRFVKDAEKTNWNNKQDALGFTPANQNHNHSGVYEPANANIQGHINSPHLNFFGLNKISVGTIEPSSPQVNDIWIDTN